MPQRRPYVVWALSSWAPFHLVPLAHWATMSAAFRSADEYKAGGWRRVRVVDAGTGQEWYR